MAGKTENWFQKTTIPASKQHKVFGKKGIRRRKLARKLVTW
jgi:hypothetical protein